MRLSIWPNANPRPKGKEEKKLVNYQVSFPNLPVTAEFFNDEELLELVTSNAWSPFVFSGKRHADNFVSTDLLVYDIDSGLTIDEAQVIIEKNNIACLCLPSPSHSEELHKFRLIIPLSRTLRDPKICLATWYKGAELFNVVDPSCKDLARFYNSSTLEDGFWNEGALFEPAEPEAKLEQTFSKHSEKMIPVSGDISEMIEAIYGEKRTVVSDAVDYFLRNAHSGLQGEWNTSLNRFCFSLAMSKVDDEVIMQYCEELAPNALDRKDLYQIKKAISDAKKV